MRVIGIILLILLLNSINVSVNAEVLRINDSEQIENGFNIEDFLYVFEDSSNTLTQPEISTRTHLFTKYSEIQIQHPQSTYWVSFEIDNRMASDVDYVLYFSQLTNVELNVIKNDTVFDTRYSGIFQIKNKIGVNDNINFFMLKQLKHESIKYLLKINHTKGYIPVFDFSVQSSSRFILKERSKERIDFMIYGAYLIFFIYTFFFFLFNRYKPYLWLSIIIFSVSLYGFAIGGYLVRNLSIDPEMLWRLTPIFSNLIGISVILLIVDFFNLKRLDKKLFNLNLLVVYLIILQIITSQVILLFPYNYELMTNFNLYMLIVDSVILPYTIFKIWKRLNFPQKLFSFATLFYFLTIIYSFIVLLIYHEQGLITVSKLMSFSGIVVIGFFTASLGEQTRQNEIERNNTLKQLDLLRLEQNRFLEKTVEEKTADLMYANQELQYQKDVFEAQKGVLQIQKSKIEILLKEIHHRVKNNLQLISSLYDIQENYLEGKDLKKVIEEGKNRIKSLSLVHNMLYQEHELGQINIKDYITQLVKQLRSLCNPEYNDMFSIECPFILLDLDTTIPLGLILNELITNSFKHVNSTTKIIEIKILIEVVEKGSYCLTLSDNGKELPNGIDVSKINSFGLKMVTLLSRQLHGKFRYEYDEKNKFIVTFRDAEERSKIQ